jgi:RNA 2',3'-cyclic 3'-phosphodiesterase
MNHRLFVAIDLAEEVRRQLQLLCGGIPGAKWVRPEQLHLTVRFIGEADGGQLADIRQALTALEHLPFILQLKGVGFFPPRGRPRVLWAGLAPCQELERLHGRVNSCLRQAGIPSEARKFAPHITLARLSNTPATRVGRFLEEHGLFASSPFAVDRILLYSSVLGRHGATHTVLQEYLLAATKKGSVAKPQTLDQAGGDDRI